MRWSGIDLLTQFPAPSAPSQAQWTFPWSTTSGATQHAGLPACVDSPENVHTTMQLFQSTQSNGDQYLNADWQPDRSTGASSWLTLWDNQTTPGGTPWPAVSPVQVPLSLPTIAPIQQNADLLKICKSKEESAGTWQAVPPFVHTPA